MLSSSLLMTDSGQQNTPTKQLSTIKRPEGICQILQHQTDRPKNHPGLRTIRQMLLHCQVGTCSAARYRRACRGSLHLARERRQGAWKCCSQWGCIICCSTSMRSTNNRALATSPPLRAFSTACNTWACRASHVSPCTPPHMCATCLPATSQFLRTCYAVDLYTTAASNGFMKGSYMWSRVLGVSIHIMTSTTILTVIKKKK